MTAAPLPGSPQQATPSGVFSVPHSEEGKWSLLSILIFIAVMAVFFMEIPVLDAVEDRGKPLEYGWMIVMFATLISAVAMAFAGLYLALVALIRRHERSWMLLLPIVLGVFVAFFAIGELGGA